MSSENNLNNLATVPPPAALLPASILLLLKERPGHGYELAERVKALGVGRSQRGVYTAAASLEREGLLQGNFDFPNRGPARRVLKVTPAGEQALAGYAEAVRQLTALVDTLLARHATVTEVHAARENRRSRRRARRRSAA